MFSSGLTRGMRPISSTVGLAGVVVACVVVMAELRVDGAIMLDLFARDELWDDVECVVGVV